MTQAQVTKTPEFKVPVENLPALYKKIADLNKKAAKLKCKESVIILGERKFEKIKSRGADPIEDAVIEAYNGEQYREYQILSVVGEIPVLAGGWSFIGKLEPHDAGTIVKSAPGHVLPRKYQKADPALCEHCNTSRRRSATFVVQNEKGKYKQVGRGCLKDFMGHASPEKYAAYAEFLFNLENELRDYEDRECRGHYNPSYANTDILAVAVAAIRRDGFVGAQYETPKQTTKGTVWENFNPPTDPQQRKFFVPLVVTDADKADGVATIQFIKDKAKINKDEFWQNLDKFVSVECSGNKELGYLSAAAMMYLKEQGQIAAKKSIRDGIVDAPIGNENDRARFKATVIGAHKYQRPTYHYHDSGMSQILTLKTSNGNLVKVFTSNLDVEKDDEVEVTGKLGRCEVESYENSPFKGLHITMLAPRARLVVTKEHQ
jgi:hypothetical protein